jgi:ABC-2 type transport system ATP-binding protein
VLILDEPTAGLDPTQIRETRKLIRELGNQHTILLSTHILSEVEMACDSVIMINQGKVAMEGTLESIRHMGGNRSLEDIFVQITGVVD